MRKCALVIGALALGLAQVSQAAVSVLTHDRLVKASISNPLDSETKTAPDANPFNETAIADVMFNAQQSTMTATQNSNFGVVGDTLTINYTGSANSNTRELPNPITLADSDLLIKFHLDAPGTWTLTGEGHVFGPGFDPGFYTSFSTVLLDSGMNIVYIFSDESLLPGVLDKIYNEAGVLAAGDYTFRARTIGGGVGFVDETATLNIQFQVNSPGGGGGPGVPLPAAGWMGAAIGSWILGRKSRR